MENTNQAHNSTSFMDNETVLATASWIAGIFLPVVAPVILLLVKKDSSPFLTQHVKESLNWQILVLIGQVLAGALTVILIGYLIAPVVVIVNVIVSILAAMEALNSKPYKPPFTLPLIK